MLERSERAESALPTGRGRGALIRHFIFRGFTLQAYLERGKGRLLPIERHKFFSRDR